MSQRASLTKRFEALLGQAEWVTAEALAMQQMTSAGDDGTALLTGVTMMAQLAAARDDSVEVDRWLDRLGRLKRRDSAFHDFALALLVSAGRHHDARTLAAQARSADDLDGLASQSALVLAHHHLGEQSKALELLATVLQRYPLAFHSQSAVLARYFAQSGRGGGWLGRRPGGAIIGEIDPRARLGAAVTLTWQADDVQSQASFTADEFLNIFALDAGDAEKLQFQLSDLLSRADKLTIAVDGETLIGSGALPPPAPIDSEVQLFGDVMQGWGRLRASDNLAPEGWIADAQGATWPLTWRQGVDPLGAPAWTFQINLNETHLSPGMIEVYADCWFRRLAGAPLNWQGPGRAQRRVPHPISAIPDRAPAETAPAIDRRIDIIIPVYNAYEETMACLNQVLHTIDRTRMEIVVIDDASSSARLRMDLDRLAEQGSITLIRNPRNFGFPRSANLGLRRNIERDKILLNADSLVFGDWADRLAKLAYERTDCGTLTPLSENATICTYPSRPADTARKLSGADAPILDHAAFDQHAWRANGGALVEIPVGVGSCLYVRAECLSETGFLSEDEFGMGYGEETDFCLRARRLGFRHFAASGVYVGHIGARSFGAQKASLIARNGPIIEALHPGYDALIQRFEQADPLAIARRRIDQQRLDHQDHRSSVLIITTDRLGGVPKFIKGRIAALESQGLRPVILMPAPPARAEPWEDAEPSSTTPIKRCRLKLEGQPGLNDLIFDPIAERADLLATLRGLNLQSAEIHHGLDHAPGVLEVAGDLGLPFDITVHDYHWICPRITLIGQNGTYCGEPELAVCERCAAAYDPSDLSGDAVARLRARSAALFARASRVIVPSRDVEQRMRRHLPTATYHRTAWEDLPPPPAPPPASDHRRVRVIVLGAIGAHKGYDILLDCARDAARRDLPLDFVLVGYSSDDRRLLETGRVFITGPYEDEEVGALLADQRGDIALLPSIWPETWSYTLSHLLATGLRLVAFDIGTPAERLRAIPHAHLVPRDIPPSRLNDGLVSLSKDARVPPDFLPAPHDRGDPMASTPINAPPSGLTVSAQAIGVRPGLLSVRVRDGGAPLAGQGVHFPAIQVQVAPQIGGGEDVKVLSSRPNGWLTQPGDVVVLQVLRETVLLVTSYTDARAHRPLEVELNDLSAPPPGVPAPTPAPVERRAVEMPRLRLTAHIQMEGDVQFDGTQWAGSVDQSRWIEAICIEAAGGLSNADIEYMSIGGNGRLSAWVKGGETTGVKGIGMPLLGFAVRLSDAAAQLFNLKYGAHFIGDPNLIGQTNGGMCRSDRLGAALARFRIEITPK